MGKIRTDKEEMEYLEKHKEEISYKDMKMVAYPGGNSLGMKMKSIYISRGDTLLMHYQTTKNYDVKTKGLEQLKFQYENHLKDDVIKTLVDKASKTLTDKHLVLDISADSIEPKEWEKVLELFGYGQ